MNIKSVLLASVAALALAGPVFAAEQTYESTTKIKTDDAGNYDEKDKTVKTDDAGTKTTFEKEAKVDIDGKGDVDKTTTTEKIVDPKGLHNKHVVKTSNKEVVKNGEVTTIQNVTVDGKTVENHSDTEPTQ